jgi:hypothetical protein
MIKWIYERAGEGSVFEVEVIDESAYKIWTDDGNSYLKYGPSTLVFDSKELADAHMDLIVDDELASLDKRVQKLKDKKDKNKKAK